MSSEISVLKKVLRAILIAENCEGMPLWQLENTYREWEGRFIPLYGYPDVAALLQSLTDTIYMELRKGQLLVFPVETEQTKHVSDMVRSQTCSRRRRPSRGAQQNAPSNYVASSMNRNGFTQKRHNSNNQIITKSQPHQNGHKKYYPNDDSCAMARNTNQQNHRQVVDYVVAENIKKMIPFQQKQSNSCGIKEITKNHNTESQNNSTENEDDVPVVVEKVFLGQPISLESENIEIDDLPKMSVDKQFQTGQSVRVFISLIHSPYKFWFQVYDSADMIDSLMEHLDLFYHREDNDVAKIPIPDDVHQIGMLCAAIYESQWHRARIIDIFDVSIKVFFVDYGTVSEIFKKDVRFLHKRFSEQPAFALRGCLENIRPNEGIWTLEAMNGFDERLRKFYNIPIMAKISAINSAEDTLYLELIDTTGVIDLKISNWLIECNFAYATKKLLINFEKRHYNEVYPSFDMLENGRYPSLQQIKEMLEDNYDFLEQENTHIIPEMFGYMTIE